MELKAILDRKQEAIERLGTLHKRMETARAFYYGDFSVLSAETKLKYHEVIPHTAKTAVDVITANMIPDNIKIDVAPLRETNEFKEHADILEETSNILHDRMRGNTSTSPVSGAVKDAVLYGLGCNRLTFIVPPDRETMGKYWMASKETRFPFRVVPLDPLVLLPAANIDNPSFVIENYKRKAYDINEEFGQNIQPETEDVDWLAYWDNKNKVYIVKDSLPLNEDTDNVYGFIPYTFFFSGLGKHSPYGKIEDKAVGLLWPLRGLLEEEARVVTAISIALQTMVVPPLLRSGGPDDFVWPMGPGETQEVGDMVAQWLPNIPVNKDFYSLGTIISQQIERAIGEKLFGGGRPTGVTTGVMEGMLLEQARKRYRPMVESIEAGYADLLGKMLCLIEKNLKEPIPGTKLKPSEIHGYYDLNVHFVHEDIAAKRINAMIARMLVMSGIIDLDTAWSKDYMNLPNATNVRKGLMKDAVMKSPELIASIVLKAAEKMDVRHLIDMAAEARQKRERLEVPGQPQVSQQAERQIEADFGGEQRSAAQRGEEEELG